MENIFSKKGVVIANFNKIVTASNKIDISTFKVSVVLNGKYDGIMKIYDLEGNWIQTLPLIIDVRNDHYKYMVPKNKLRLHSTVITNDIIHHDARKFLPNYVTKPEFYESGVRVDHDTLDDNPPSNISTPKA